MSDEEARDAIDGYSPTSMVPHDDPATDPTVLEALGEMDAQRMDDFINQLTGIGTISHDKTLGGVPNGVLPFRLRLLTGSQCRDRWRGSPLGHAIITKVPSEMTRAGFETSVQLMDDEDFGDVVNARLDAVGRLVRARKDAGHALRDREERDRWYRRLRATYDAQVEAQAGRTHLSPVEVDDRSGAIAELVEARMTELGADDKIREALCYERAYGGGVVLMGIDDGRPLTAPVDEKRIKNVTHLTPLRGGWDGEVLAWSYYRDMTGPRYGDPETYMLRNLGVPIAKIPAPGEDPRFEIPGDNKLGTTVGYIHESRLLVFQGMAADHYARVQMRGWADSIFTRVDESLSQFSTSWGAIVNAITEFSQGVLKIDGLAKMLSGKDPKGEGNLMRRALLLQMTQSVARARLLDKDEEWTRESIELGGVAAIMEQLNKVVAMAADMPEALLLSSSKGGLRSGDEDTRGWYDRVNAMQISNVIPPRRRLARYLMLAKEGVTRGREPQQWSMTPKSLWQPTQKEQADARKTTAETDAIYIDKQVLTPEEVAASAFGGAKWTMERTIDLAGRQAVAEANDADAAAHAAEQQKIALPNAPQVPSSTDPDTGAAPVVAGGGVELTPSAVANIITVNEARAKMGYPPVTDGDLTVTEYTAKRAQVVAEAANAELGTVGKPPEADKPTPAPLAAGGAKPFGNATAKTPSDGDLTKAPVSSDDDKK